MNRPLSSRQRWTIARLAFWYLDRRRWAEAETLARGLLTLDQRDGLAWMYYAEARRHQDDLAEAARGFGEAARLLGDRADVWMRLGDSLLRLGKYADARRALDQALAHSGGDEALERRIQSLLKMCNRF